MGWKGYSPWRCRWGTGAMATRRQQAACTPRPAHSPQRSPYLLNLIAGSLAGGGQAVCLHHSDRHGRRPHSRRLSHPGISKAENA